MFKTMRVALLGCALLGVATANYPLSASPLADGSAQEGSAKAGVCLACHGMNGNSSNPEWPSLAGQSAVYIAEQLRLFRSGGRNNPLMQPIVATLSEDDIDDLAAYYAAQTPKGLESDPSYWKAGEKLYRAGDATRNIPACVACHGPTGAGNPAAGYPALRAQHAVYTVKQLNDYANGTRYPQTQDAAVKSRNGHVMVTISQRLTAEDIRNLSSYVQGLR
jgi:cytochrome c553